MLRIKDFTRSLPVPTITFTRWGNNRSPGALPQPLIYFIINNFYHTGINRFPRNLTHIFYTI